MASFILISSGWLDMEVARLTFLPVMYSASLTLLSMPVFPQELWRNVAIALH